MVHRLSKKLSDEGKNILIEGDRINNLKTFEFVKSLGVDVSLYLIVCSVETSLESKGNE